MANSIDLGRVVGAPGAGIPAGGADGQVLVKDGAGDYAGRWERRPRTVNGIGADENDDIQIRKVALADNLEAEDAQQSAGEYIIRTTGGEASLEDGDAWLVRINGRRIHSGYVPGSINMTVTPVERMEPITATIDEEVFKEYVETSGTTTLTYTDEWSADPELYGVTVIGEPVDGDVITIVYVKENAGTITVSNPSAFISTGWNLYDNLKGYARVLKYSTERQFLVGGNYTALEYSETLDGDKTEIVVSGSSFAIPGDGYVWVTGGDNSTTYILMTWSDWTGGYTGDWQGYIEYEVDLSGVMEDYFPDGLFQVGAISDVIDLSMKKAVSNIMRLDNTNANMTVAKESGRPYEYDENYIYLVREEGIEYSIDLDGEYTASDHGMEYFTGTEVPVLTETLYGMNLKEMLSHDIPIQLAKHEQEIETLRDGLAIIVNGDECAAAVPVGGFAYIKNNQHGLAEGLYQNTSGSAFPTTGGTADDTVFTAVSGGGLNALNNKIASQPIATGETGFTAVKTGNMVTITGTGLSISLTGGSYKAVLNVPSDLRTEITPAPYGVCADTNTRKTGYTFYSSNKIFISSSETMTVTGLSITYPV